MFVEHVWPFRELRDSTERKTFFWLECSYDEAIDVLHKVALSAEDFRRYVEYLHEFRANNLGEREVDQGLEVYKRIGFLISEDGKIVEWAPPGFPISNMWDAYNPFERVEATEVKTFDEFAKIARAFRKANPYYSTATSSSRIPARVDLSLLRGEDPDRVANHLIGGSELGMHAAKAFYSKYVPGAVQEDGEQYFIDDAFGQRHLAETYESSKAQLSAQVDETCKHAIDFAHVGLEEIYQRKNRAIANLRSVEKQLLVIDESAGFPVLPALKALSDDEICELALLMERHHRSPAIKWILGEFIERVRPIVTFDDLPESFERICPSPQKLRDIREAIISDL